MDMKTLGQEAEKTIIQRLLQKAGDPALIGEDFFARIARFVNENLEAFLKDEQAVLNANQMHRLSEHMPGMILCDGPYFSALQDSSVSRLEVYQSAQLHTWKTEVEEPEIRELHRVPYVIEVLQSINNLTLNMGLHLEESSPTAQVSAGDLTLTVTLPAFAENGLVLTAVRDRQTS
jgi:hypothetical protein